MLNFSVLLIATWLVVEILSIAMLLFGSQVAQNRWLLWLGKKSHEKKMKALEKYWPLTRIRPALERQDVVTCTIILSGLIILKSAASCVLGVIVVFWLPLASLVVPSIVAVHDADDQELKHWAREVASLQVTSHALAASLGFSIFVHGRYLGQTIMTTIQFNWLATVIVCLASLAFAIVAGISEAKGIVYRGI